MTWYLMFGMLDIGCRTNREVPEEAKGAKPFAMAHVGARRLRPGVNQRGVSRKLVRSHHLSLASGPETSASG